MQKTRSKNKIMKVKTDNYFKLFTSLIKNKKFSEIFGEQSSWKWHNDPRQFFISMARYKFVAKIFSGKKKVLEVGCSDGFNSRIVRQEVNSLDICDIEEKMLINAKKIMSSKWKIGIFLHNFLKKKLKIKYDGIYLLDVLEHINKKNEKRFISNIISSLGKNGLLIVGIPSKEFQKYSAPPSVNGHINCKTYDELKKSLEKFFYNVIIFSMNDEIVHTGFKKMSPYFLAVCSCKK